MTTDTSDGSVAFPTSRVAVNPVHTRNTLRERIGLPLLRGTRTSPIGHPVKNGQLLRYDHGRGRLRSHARRRRKRLLEEGVRIPMQITDGLGQTRSVLH